MEISERDEARFWSKVALPNGEGCMLWRTGKNGDGYGMFRLGARTISAHRISYVLAYGPIPDGLQIDHVKERGCTNRHCVAPDHLEAVTSAENTRRGAAGSNHRLKTHCPQGHAYAGENLRILPDGARKCRACVRSRCRTYRQRKRSAAA